MKRWMMAAMAGALVLLAGCGGQQSPQWMDTTFRANWPEEGTQNGVKVSVEFVVPRIDNTTEHNQAWNAINEYFSMMGESWMQKLEEYLYLPDLQPGEYRVESGYEVVYQTEKLASIVQRRVENLGGAYPTNAMFGDVVDLQDGHVLAMDELFNVDSFTYQPRLLDMIQQQADYPREQLEGYFDFNFWYLTEDDLVIFYQEDTLAPHAAGVLAFPLPIADLKDIWALEET